MNRQFHHTRTLAYRPLMLLVILIAGMAMARADVPRRVIIASDWDFAPYEFINDKGQSDGFNVEVLHIILKSLGIEHEFVMKSRKQSIEMFLNHEADLIVDYRNRFHDEQFFHTRTPLSYYQIMLAHRKSMPSFTSLDMLRGQKSIVFNGSNDSISKTLLEDLLGNTSYRFCSAREALAGVANGEYNYFVWGNELLKWKIKEYNIEDITLDKLDINATEILVTGYNKELIDEIDSEFARMQQKGDIDRIREKWFYVDSYSGKASATAIIISLIIILAAILLTFVYLVTKRRMKRAILRNEDLEAMMHQALKMGKFAVMSNNLKQNRVTNLHGHLVPEDGCSYDEILKRVHPDDRNSIIHRNDTRKTKAGEATPFSLRWNNGTDDAQEWINVTGYSFLEYDEHERAESLIITARDITEDLAKERKDKEMASRYRRMFDSSLVAMSFYDKNGRLIDLNDKMRELLDITDKDDPQIMQTSIFDFGMIKGEYQLGTKETLHACQHMQYPTLNLNKFIEIRIKPSLDEDGNPMHYIVTARDVSEERGMYMELRQQNMALQVTTDDNRRYEEEMRTLMENSNMYVWTLDMKTNIISFSHTLGKPEFTRTLEEHIQSMFEDEQEAALERMQNLNNLGSTFNTLHHFKYTPIDKAPAWYATSGMPIYDQDGNLEALFGIVRNITPLMDIQVRLKEETARAKNSGLLKSTFLANMTHEIRTPLNAIVGFSDLLHMVSTTEERKEFIHIIRNNCDMLLRLINDIFEASTIDAKPLEIKPTEVDFAQEFKVICQSLSQRVQEPGVAFIIDNPYSSFVTYIDKGRIQQVITNFVTNAVKYTHKGHIRVGYRHVNNGIYIYCEDTGAGIPKEKQKSVFERFVKLNDFVQGTGLGLSICKSIAERSNGRIGVESKGEGHGSTFWIWVPSPVTSQPLDDSQPDDIVPYLSSYANQ
ncbi:MAG: transporter substrate-binding domain-containing protein [Prevotella sp.]|nr:transporter substrate-binding domain-containing protein [Prevotella sp.]